MSKLYFRYGAMNSGKTTLLLQVAHNYEERGMKVVILKPGIDTKGNDKIVTRIGLKRKVDHIIKQDEKLSNYLNKLSEDIVCILVDEAQFLTPKQVDELAEVVDMYGIPVLCYGLRADAFSHVFPGSQRLFEIADKLEELKAICKCGKKATFNLRYNKINGENIPVFEGEQISIDGIDADYDSVCRPCYKKLRREYEKKKE